MSYDEKMTLSDGKELQDSPVWSRVEKEIDFRINLAVSELRHCSKDDLEKCQIRIDCLEELKKLPQDVIDRES